MSVYDIAEEFVQFTGRSVFLTGKAGTGKTTFLRRMREQTHKQMAVVAPTGVAAINAGGVTIHSFFQLPFTPFVPTNEGRANLIAKQHVTSVRRKIFQELELLVIDEISMVRADVLDAMDAILRHYRYRYQEPFGGVQVIFIGDMYQLSPVAVGDEWSLLSQFYASPYFFHSQVISQQTPVYIELDHIFRQTNQQFIRLLNEVRNNQLSADGFELLNLRYNPDFRPQEGDGYITLTTHNRKADTINAEEMAKIEAPIFTYEAKIQGEFSDKSYPNDALLALKVGAKVMFIANDVGADRKYFNGKLGIVTSLSETEIFVTCDGETEPLLVIQETWQNIRYSVNKETNQIEEEELGSYTQFPLRLAWAITIHKSQGLTFDKVVIDAGSAFASGQVYVALSRCRSLDGIVLTTPINQRSLVVDEHVLDFSERKTAESELEQQVQAFKSQYNAEILRTAFDFSMIAGMTRSFVNYIGSLILDFNDETQPFLNALQTQVYELQSVSDKFLRQLNLLCAENNTDKLQERLIAASDFFVPVISEIMDLAEQSPAVTDSRTEALDYAARLTNIYEQLAAKKHLLAGIREDFSVTHYFELKATFKVPKFNVHVYAGDKKTKQKLPIKNAHLYQELATLRNELCQELNVPVYMVADTKMLVEVSNLLPQTPEELMRIKGFGKMKVQRYGFRFLDLVRAYCKQNGLAHGMQEGLDFDEIEIEVSVTKTKTKKEKNTKETKPKAEKGATYKITETMCREGKSLQEIAQERQMALSTIESHVVKLITEGALSVYDFIDETVVTEIVTKLVMDTSLTEVYDAFEGRISYTQLRFVQAHYQAKRG